MLQQETAVIWHNWDSGNEMIRYSLMLLILFFPAVLFSDDKPEAEHGAVSKPSASAEHRLPRTPEIHTPGEYIEGMVEYPPGSGKFYPKRKRSRPVKISTPGGLFPTEKTEVPASTETQLGGTVPALWEIKPLSPAQEDDELPPLLERDSIAPTVSAKVIRFTMQFLQQHDTNGDGILQKDEWKTMSGAPQAIDIDGDGIITEEELVRFIGLYGKNRTIHNPNPAEQYYYPRMVSSQFQIFKPVTAAGETVDSRRQTAEEKTGYVQTPDEKNKDKKENKLEDTSLDITEDILEAAEAEETDEMVDAAYEKIISGKLKQANKIYYTPREKLYGVPAWFILRDRNGDGQVSLTEFAPTLSAASLALFGRLDKDGDGFIVPDEVRKPNPLTVPKTPIPPDEPLPVMKTDEPEAEEVKPAERNSTGN